MTNYLLLTVSVLACSTSGTLFTLQSRRALDTKFRSYLFNAAMFLATFLLFAATAIGEGFSTYSLLFGIVFGVISATGTICQIFALSRGPMHITTLIITSSMIIPALSDVFFVGIDAISIPKVIAIAVLIFFLFCAAGKQRNAVPAKRGWLVLCLASFFCVATVGIMQKIQQSSSHKEETSLFLAASFFASMLFSLLLAGLARKEHMALRAVGGGVPQKATRSYIGVFIAVAVVCGIAVYLNNDLNLKLSGQMPSQIFFPIVNGVPVVLNSLVAMLLFRERLSRRQAIGLIGGTLSLVAICLLP